MKYDSLLNINVPVGEEKLGTKEIDVGFEEKIYLSPHFYLFFLLGIRNISLFTTGIFYICNIFDLSPVVQSPASGNSSLPEPVGQVLNSFVAVRFGLNSIFLLRSRTGLVVFNVSVQVLNLKDWFWVDLIFQKKTQIFFYFNIKKKLYI